MTTPEDRIKAAKQALYDLIVDHSMWIDGDGNPLDYSPDREAAIGDFLDAAESVLAALFPAAETVREWRVWLGLDSYLTAECVEDARWLADRYEGQVQSRTRTTYAEHVSPWEDAEVRWAESKESE